MKSNAGAGSLRIGLARAMITKNYVRESLTFTILIKRQHLPKLQPKTPSKPRVYKSAKR
jgi:hypothetical protein